MERITTTIKREWLGEIVARTKKIEYRAIKPYWTKRLNGIVTPFELRLINGMHRPIPEVTVLVQKVKINRRLGSYELHIKRVLRFKHWNKEQRRPGR
jgi:hypothetical protein